MPNNYDLGYSNIPMATQSQWAQGIGEDSEIYNQMFEYYFSLYEDAGRAEQAARNAIATMSRDPSMTQLLNQSGDVQRIRQLLGQDLEGRNPYLAEARQRAIGDINKQTSRGAEAITQNLAQQNLQGGAGVNALNRLYAGSQEATSGANVQFGLANQQIRNQAIAQLLGLGQMEMGAAQSDRQYRMGLRDYASRMRFGQAGLSEQGADFDWGDWANIGTKAVGIGALAAGQPWGAALLGLPIGGGQSPQNQPTSGSNGENQWSPTPGYNWEDPNSNRT